MALCASCGAKRQRGGFCGTCGVPLHVPESRRLAPASRKRAWLVGSLAVVAFAALGGGAFALSRPAPSHTLQGEAIIYDGREFPAEVGTCDGSNDLATGSQITVLDGAGEVAGVGVFEPGVLTGRGGCRLSFAIPNVHESDYYQLRTQSTIRPSTTYELADLKATKWHLQVSVGDAEDAARESRADCLPTSEFSVQGTVTAKLVPFEDSEVWMWTLEGSVTNRSDEDSDVSLSWGVGWMDKWLGGLQTASFGSVTPSGESAGSTDLRVRGNKTKKFAEAGMYVKSGMWGREPTDVEFHVLSAVRADSGAEMWCMTE